MDIRRRWIIVLGILIALSSLESTEGSSNLKKVRRSIENSDDDNQSGDHRRQLTLGYDVFSQKKKELNVTRYHRRIGQGTHSTVREVARRIGSMLKSVRNQLRRAMDNILGWFIGILQSMQSSSNESTTLQEASPAPTLSAIYDSFSNAVPGSSGAAESPSTAEQQRTRGKPSRNTQPTKTTTTTPTNNKQKATTKSAPLRSNTNLPKATSTRSAFGNNKKSASAGGSSFDAMNTAAISATEEEDENAVVHSTSLLAGLLPTLVAGLVFTTAGSMVGYLWNGEWAETASSVYNYYWGDGEATAEQSYSYLSMDTFESMEEEYNSNSAGGGGGYYSNDPARVTPDRKHRDDHDHHGRLRDEHGRFIHDPHHTYMA